MYALEILETDETPYGVRSAENLLCAFSVGCCFWLKGAENWCVCV